MPTIDRRKLMVVTQTVMLTSAGLLTAITVAGIASVWPIYGLSALARGECVRYSGAAVADADARSSAEVFPNAVSLGLLVFNVATIAGPAIRGFLSLKVDQP